MLRLVLEFEGAVVTDAIGAAEGLRVLNSSKVDVLLTDTSSAERGLDGAWLMKEIRAIPGSADVCVIALTDRKEIGRSLGKVGFAAVLIKPIDTADLCDFILACLPTEQ